MTLLFIIFCIWGASALVRMSKERKRQEEMQRRAAEVDRMRSEWREEQKRNAERTRAMIALQREQERQRKEQERLEKEREKQAEILRKHEMQIMKLEERMAVAEGEIEFQAQQIERLREHIEHAEMERDACVYGSSRYYQWDKKCLALEKQIHTAESKMAKAQYIKTSAQKEMEGGITW